MIFVDGLPTRRFARDLHAGDLHLLGFDNKELTYRYQGLDQKLTRVDPA